VNASGAGCIGAAVLPFSRDFFLGVWAFDWIRSKQAL